MKTRDDTPLKPVSGRSLVTNEKTLFPEPVVTTSLYAGGAADLSGELALLKRELDQLRHREALASQRGASTEAQLREVSRQLIAATAKAREMEETAEQATALLSHMAGHDILTGLPNRFLLSARLEHVLEVARGQREKVALLYLDLDHFKHINDSLGHAVGDELLKSVALRLQESVRITDMVSRQGSDEFVVLLPEVDEHEAVNSAEKIIEAIHRPHPVGDHLVHVDVSIGISLYPDYGRDAGAVIRNANTAMYYARKNGHNCFQVFTPDMHDRAIERRAIVAALHQALEQHEFRLYYQPKVNLETGAIAGAEALIRWQRPDGQLVSPVKFVSIAEECGFILPIGKWVLAEACRQVRAWLQAGLEPGHVAVNFSAKEFRSRGFLGGIRSALADSGLDPHHLELELTESGIMHDSEPALALLHALKQLGVQIAIDDFGTGYSSLSYLQRFPIDTLKIDQSFVRDIRGDGNHGGEAIVAAVIAMGLNLNYRVVAEGVETQRQLAFLRSHRCDLGQGYYFGRPMNAGEFTRLLMDSFHK